MASYRDERKPDRTGLWIVLVVLGGVVLVVALLCGGAVWAWMTLVRTTREIAQDVQRQVGDEMKQGLREVADEAGQHMGSQLVSYAFASDCAFGRHNAAWAATSKGFRRVSRQDFEALLAKHNLGRLPVGTALPKTFHVAGPHRYRYEVQTFGGQPVTLTVQMTREGETWKVEDLSIDPLVGKEKE